MTAPTRKVLMLHGYTQSGAIFSKRVAAMRKACPKDIEFVFVDAPTILAPSDLANTFGASLESFGSGEASTQASDPALLPRAWWKTDATRTASIGLEESIAYIRDLLKKDTFEGVFGFSQGAAFAGLISALLEHPERYPAFMIDGQSPHPPFQFCVSVAGFRTPGALADSLFEGGFDTPTLHVLGRGDILVVEERARQLVKVTNVHRVVEHEGGHFVPSKGSWRKFFAAYFAHPAELLRVPAPGLASGTATPVSEPADAPSRGSVKDLRSWDGGSICKTWNGS